MFSSVLSVRTYNIQKLNIILTVHVYYHYHYYHCIIISGKI
jgi:hypothetical protein